MRRGFGMFYLTSEKFPLLQNVEPTAIILMLSKKIRMGRNSDLFLEVLAVVLLTSYAKRTSLNLKCRALQQFNECSKTGGSCSEIVNGSHLLAVDSKHLAYLCPLKALCCMPFRCVHIEYCFTRKKIIQDSARFSLFNLFVRQAHVPDFSFRTTMIGSVIH